MSSVLRHTRRANWRISFLFLTFLLFNPISPSAQPAQQSAEPTEEAAAEEGPTINGGELFEAKCRSCHNKSEVKKTGPGLLNVRDRIPPGEWLYEWVWNSDKVKASGDAYAKTITEEANGALMTAFPTLTREEIDAILDDVDANPDPVDEEAVAGGGGDVAESGSSTTLILWLVGLSILLYIVIKMLGIVKTSLILVGRREDDEDDEEFEDVSHARGIMAWAGNNKRYVALIVIVLLGMGAVDGWNRLINVGVYQDYEPEQPIWFSHKIHAGENEINCVYCHHSAEKGKAAGIPSANVCMNCHVAIPEGKQTGTTEIAKIYKAVGYDAETESYDPTAEKTPIKWVKVHNLPEFAYFNHSQHVVVGKQECKTCHGEVEKMDVLKQHSELTMGWCVNCHRETQLTMEKDNEYYKDIKDDLRLKHADLGLEEFTVAQNGGLECAKCHY